jgi:hypothetical protein
VLRLFLEFRNCRLFRVSLQFLRSDKYEFASFVSSIVIHMLLNQATRLLYSVLFWRQWRSPLFLRRCLRGPPKSECHALQRRPSVRYTCGHKSFPWFQDVPKMGCLWCHSRRCIQFEDCCELLLHLGTCHGRFRYICDHYGSGTGSDSLVVIKVRETRDIVGMTYYETSATACDGKRCSSDERQFS